MDEQMREVFEGMREADARNPIIVARTQGVPREELIEALRILTKMMIKHNVTLVQNESLRNYVTLGMLQMAFDVIRFRLETGHEPAFSDCNYKRGNVPQEAANDG